MNSMIAAIAKANTVEELKALLQWMTENDINEGYVRTAIQKLDVLEAPDY